MNLTPTKNICEKNGHSLPDYNFFNKESPDFLQQFSKVVKTSLPDSKNVLLSYLVNSQIWLNLFVVDCQFGYITKFKKQILIRVADFWCSFFEQVNCQQVT
jgi:hypothetical protein